jgi:periplasmic protein TonB
MKKNFSIFVLLLTFVFWQGCGSKTQEATNESIAKEEAVKAKEADALAAKKAWLVKASAEKADQRRLAAAEKAKLSMTYRDASGKIVYNKAEIDPSYTGGEDAMRKYLKDNLKYPTEAFENGVEGTVFVEFVIDEKGRVREVVATDVVGEDVDLSLKEEAVRVVASMPGWIAGLQHGKSVDTSFSIPITFEIVK